LNIMGSMTEWRQTLLFVLAAAFVVSLGALAMSSSTVELVLVVITTVLLGISLVMELRDRRRSRRRSD